MSILRLIPRMELFALSNTLKVAFPILANFTLTARDTEETEK
jgi:hypothetical protein